MIYNNNSFGYYCQECYRVKLKDLSVRDRINAERNSEKKKRINDREEAYNKLKKVTKQLVKSIGKSILLFLLLIKQFFNLFVKGQ